MSQPSETISEIVADWGRERPDLDASPILIIGAMARLTQLFEPHLRPPFAAIGLGHGDFDVLAALRRVGHPFTLTPGELADSLLVTSGAVTKRIDRLESRGLVQRTVSEADARGRYIALTKEGVELSDTLIAAHLTNEAKLLAGLSSVERDELATLLERLVTTIEMVVHDNTVNPDQAD